MLKRVIVLVLAFFLVFGAFSPLVYAKKKLPHLSGSSAPAPSRTYTGGGTRGVTVSVKFRSDRRGIIANFSNLGIASSVTYQLTYTSRGINEGAGGAISNLGAGSTSRDLLFGTCSRGVCRYHTGITNAKFVVTTTLPSGIRVVKVFRLRV